VVGDDDDGGICTFLSCETLIARHSIKDPPRGTIKRSVQVAECEAD